MKLAEFLLQNRLGHILCIGTASALACRFFLPGYLWPEVLVLALLGGGAGYGLSFKYPPAQGWKAMTTVLVLALIATAVLVFTANSGTPLLIGLLHAAAGLSSLGIFYFFNTAADRLMAGGGGDGGDGAGSG